MYGDGDKRKYDWTFDEFLLKMQRYKYIFTFKRSWYDSTNMYMYILLNVPDFVFEFLTESKKQNEVSFCKHFNANQKKKNKT